MHEAQNVIQLIEHMTGYTPPCEDKRLIEYLIDKEEQSICNFCNTDFVNQELMYIVEERAAGAYMAMKSSIIIDDEGFNVVTSVKEGDTTVEFSGTSSAARLNELISSYTRDRQGELLRFRKLVW